MKKLMLLVLPFVFALTARAEVPYFDGIYDGYQVVYSPTAKAFMTGGMAEDRIVLSKKTSSGTGGYSEYFAHGKSVLTLGSNFEFVMGKDLIAVHSADLKFYKVGYKKGAFFEKKMSYGDVKNLFPGVTVIKMSKFKKGEYTLTKEAGKDLDVLLFNDTKQNFYKYSFTPATVKNTDIAGLIKIKNTGKIEFAHYGDNTAASPKYTLTVN